LLASVFSSGLDSFRRVIRRPFRVESRRDAADLPPATPTICPNQAFFKRILITDDLEVDAELAEPFNTLLSDELRKAAINEEAHETQQAIQDAHRRRNHNHNDDNESAGDADPLVSSTAPPPGSFPGDGFSQKILVRMRGLEPPRELPPHGPEPCASGPDASARVQIVRFAGFRGRIGRIWRGECCQTVVTPRASYDVPQWRPSRRSQPRSGSP
jgi:hypothetical protein